MFSKYSELNNRSVKFSICHTNIFVGTEMQIILNVSVW